MVERDRPFLHPADPDALRTRMKRVFIEGFSVMDIARPLLSFGVEEDAAAVAGILAEREVRLAGLRCGGVVAGYVQVEDLDRGLCGDHLRPILSSAMLPETASLPEVIEVLDRDRMAFVTLLGEVGALVTREDFEKLPVRMWLFGMITIVEMDLTQRIQDRYPLNAWRDLLTPGRLAKAKALQAERQRRNEQVWLLDCLQLSDKAIILLKDPELRAEFGFDTVREGKRAIKDFESLRNNLAHTQKIVTHNWDPIVGIARNLDRFITRL